MYNFNIQRIILTQRFAEMTLVEIHASISKTRYLMIKFYRCNIIPSVILLLEQFA